MVGAGISGTWHVSDGGRAATVQQSSDRQAISVADIGRVVGDSPQAPSPGPAYQSRPSNMSNRRRLRVEHMTDGARLKERRMLKAR
jgi:hypothetical protein